MDDERTDVLERLAQLEQTVGQLEETLSSSVASLERKIQKLARRVPKSKGRPGSRATRPKEPYLPYLIDLGGLRPESAVLDVGCGVGKITAELAPYLGTRGSYHGIEIRRRLVDMLEERYRELPNFHFYFADVANSLYNASGAGPATAYRFPLADASVDVVVLRSVFTHMLPDEVERYVSEIARVLAKGGRSLITYFLTDEQTQPSAAQKFPHDHGIYRLHVEESPGSAVALDEGFVRDTYARHGLRIVEPILHGSWAGRSQGAALQDLVIAER